VRYADDCNVYVRSEAAGRRVMMSITRFIERRLKLQVNAEKSAVAHAWQRSFLSFTLAQAPLSPAMRN
jgi:retron-type reverse transcriptase